MVRDRLKPKFEELVPLLGSTHRYVAYAATRLLETVPADEYQADVLKAKTTACLCKVRLAMLVMDPIA